MRATKAKIYLDHLTYNIKQVTKSLKQDTRVCGVVKADGYGHGAIQIAKQLVSQGVDYLAVALAQEALELRQAGIDIPILVLTPVETPFMSDLIENHITMTTTDSNHAKEISHLAEELNLVAKVHLKVDSGMSRIGVQDGFEAGLVLKEFEGKPVNVEGIYTHFADADNMNDSSFTHQQFKHFMQVVEKLEAKGHHFDIKHACNSAATIRFPQYHLDMVRIGICMYGYQPDESMRDLIDLKPLMTVESKIAFKKTLQPNRVIGYGCTYQVKEQSEIATLVLGYADGVLRTLSNKGSFIIDGQKAPIVGRVCMDQLMVDITKIPNANVGEIAIWFGNETKNLYSLFEISKESGSFHYEILTRIGSRIPREYI